MPSESVSSFPEKAYIFDLGTKGRDTVFQLENSGKGFSHSQKVRVILRHGKTLQELKKQRGEGSWTPPHIGDEVAVEYFQPNPDETEYQCANVYFKEEYQSGIAKVLSVSDYEMRLKDGNDAIIVRPKVFRGVGGKKLREWTCDLREEMEVYYQAVENKAIFATFASEYRSVSAAQRKKQRDISPTTSRASTTTSKTSGSKRNVVTLPHEKVKDQIGIIIETSTQKGVVWSRDLGRVSFNRMSIETRDFGKQSVKLTIHHTPGKWVRFDAEPVNDAKTDCQWKAERLRLNEDNNKPIQALLQYKRFPNDQFAVYGIGMVATVFDEFGTLWSEQLGRIYVDTCTTGWDYPNRMVSQNIVRFAAEVYKEGYKDIQWCATEVLDVDEPGGSSDAWMEHRATVQEKYVELAEAKPGFALLKTIDTPPERIWMSYTDYYVMRRHFVEEIKKPKMFKALVVPTLKRHSTKLRAILVTPLTDKEALQLSQRGACNGEPTMEPKTAMQRRIQRPESTGNKESDTREKHTLVEQPGGIRRESRRIRSVNVFSVSADDTSQPSPIPYPLHSNTPHPESQEEAALYLQCVYPDVNGSKPQPELRKPEQESVSGFVQRNQQQLPKSYVFQSAQFQYRQKLPLEENRGTRPENERQMGRSPDADGDRSERYHSAHSWNEYSIGDSDEFETAEGNCQSPRDYQRVDEVRHRVFGSSVSNAGDAQDLNNSDLISLSNFEWNTASSPDSSHPSASPLNYEVNIEGRTSSKKTQTSTTTEANLIKAIVADAGLFQLICQTYPSLVQRLVAFKLSKN